jgi:glycosyltransferase involved in cell wall biosynthesis
MIAACPPAGANSTFEHTEPQTQIGSLLVFSDDWGRHPSSCQHLIRNLLDRYPVLWVNTIGTRAPRLDLQTLKRVAEKVRQWGSKSSRVASSGSTEDTADKTHRNLTVVNPRMWPWFGGDRDRRFNRWLLSKQLAPLIQQLPKPVVAVTTLPITADLPGLLPVDRWVYYCVDDFSQWPGLDGETLRRMDHDMIRRADSIVAVSETLQAMIAAEGRQSSLLTHGVDVDFWRVLSSSCRPDRAQRVPAMGHDVGTHVVHSGLLSEIVFWGVIDRRMDSPTLKHLSQKFADATITLIGPQQDPDPEILSLPNLRTLPAQPLAALPEIAAKADVLIMPYADLPVTRAMQPLKLKEYLATGKPVVVNRLPSTDAWADCMDVATNPEQFAQLVADRISSGLPTEQLVARQRLELESWRSKAEQFERCLSQVNGER